MLREGYNVSILDKIQLFPLAFTLLTQNLIRILASLPLVLLITKSITLNAVDHRFLRFFFIRTNKTVSLQPSPIPKCAIDPLIYQRILCQCYVLACIA